MGGSPIGGEGKARGVLGNRMEFLCKDADVRLQVEQRLQAGEDPFHVFKTISVRGIGINVKDDSKTSFKGKLKGLLGGNADKEYEDADKNLLERNRDTKGNRDAFFGWWWDRRELPNLREHMSGAVIEALQEVQPDETIEVVWDANLGAGDPEADVSSDVGDPQPPDLIFHTRPEAIEAGQNLPARPPED